MSGHTATLNPVEISKIAPRGSDGAAFYTLIDAITDDDIEVKRRNVFNSYYYTIKVLDKVYKLSAYQVNVLRTVRDCEITTTYGYWNILICSGYVRRYMSYYQNKIIDLEINKLIERVPLEGSKKNVWRLTDMGRLVLGLIESYERASTY